MAHKRSLGMPLAILLLASLGVLSSGWAVAQAQAPDSRLAGDWRSSYAVMIPASSSPVIKGVQGPAPAGMRLERMLLLLAPSESQQQALATELGNLQESGFAQISPLAYAVRVCRILFELCRGCCSSFRMATEPGFQGCAFAGRPRLDRVFRNGCPGGTGIP